MEIIRTVKYSDDLKNQEYQLSEWNNYKPYHKIEIIYYNNILKIDIEYNYIVGHGSEEVDKIYNSTPMWLVFKTQDKEKINSEIEKTMIQQIINNINNSISQREDNIKDNLENIKVLNHIKKDFIKTFYRGDKIKRLLD